MLPSGARNRVSFNPVTGGGSTFTTSDAGIQEGLENHSFFGRQFVLAEVKDDAKPTVDNGVTSSTHETKKEESNGPKQVKVASLDDAKEYLVETFGLSRTKLRSKAQINAAASENGIEFVGI